jgi:serine/threonine protein kinase
MGKLRRSRAPWGHHESVHGAEFEHGTNRSVLNTLAGSLGAVPRILLRETEPSALTPVVRPSSREMPGAEPAHERYQFLGEIARGGMGAVLKGRDTDLGRDLAVKVLLDKHRDNPDLIRRFIEEAQIGGRLQHPGIVPVYELGCFDDRRPFFTMKLVKGHTLAALLAARADGAHERPRFLAIFEAVCQTMAYAHARGVIHRDLKPHNVMVGSFGEVQVMDWGLAKVLRTASVIDLDTPEPEHETFVQTARSGSETRGSSAGCVLGTPEYMPPEQARGEISAVDERADVFSLGGILCEILTGQPPYSGRTAAEVHFKAASGDLTEALDRLDKCGADADLLELARQALAPRTQDRSRDASAVAKAMTAYLAGVQERLRAAELAQAQAQARTIEERKRRKTQLRMAAAILLVVASGAAGVATQWSRAQANYRKAQSRFDLAREAIARFYTGASEDVLLKEPQLKPLRDKLLGSALEFYKKLQASLEAESGEAPGAELAAAYEQVGKITGQIGSYSSAIESLQQARMIHHRLAEQQPDSDEPRAALARVLEQQSAYLAEVARATEALDALQQARLLRQRIAGDHTGVIEHRINLAQTDVSLSRLLGHRFNRLDEAIAVVEGAIRTYEDLTSANPTDASARRGLGDALHVLGMLRHESGSHAKAFESYDQAVAVLERLAAEHPADLELHETLARSLGNRGNAATELHRLDEADSSYQRARTTYEQLVRDQPNATRFQFNLAHSHQSTAWWLSRTQRLPDVCESEVDNQLLPVSNRLADNGAGDVCVWTEVGIERRIVRVVPDDVREEATVLQRLRPQQTSA